ncbi:MAG TPA: hypothetical protein DHV62_06210 [Elusimicrobia bacterium]|jgi:hypothetical protein|nr:hypothetical protein [Elusimicrobiota bacterium]
MHAKIHKELAFQLLEDYPNPNLLKFLVEGTAKQGWKEKKDKAIKEKWLKEWMDMPDNKKHSSKQKNDHSYKLEKIGKTFRIKFIGKKPDQGTVIARLKYDSRDVKEWKVEEEIRTCAIELAKSIHWVIDFSTPPHTVAGWNDKEHAKIEKDFDKVWEKLYDKKKIKFGRIKQIKDIYRWAKKFVEEKYARNCDLLNIYRSRGSILKGKGKSLGQEVILDLAQNLADYLAYHDKMLNFSKMVTLV